MDTEINQAQPMTTNQTPNAYLSATVPCVSGIGTEVITYVTKDFAEVYRFRKICVEHKMAHSVRFKKVEISDYSHVVKPSMSQTIKNNLKSVYKKITNH